MASTSGLTRIAAVVPQWDSGIRDILRGILKHVERAEQSWLEIFSNDSTGLEAFEKWRPAGVIASLDSPKLGQWARQLDVPVVNISLANEVPGIVRVGVDDESIGELAAKRFDRAWLQRAWDSSEPGNTLGQAARQGFSKRLATVGIEKIPTLAINDPAGKSTMGQAALPELINWLKTLPATAVFCSNDLCARLLGRRHGRRDRPTRRSGHHGMWR